MSSITGKEQSEASGDAKDCSTYRQMYVQLLCAGGGLGENPLTRLVKCIYILRILQSPYGLFGRKQYTSVYCLKNEKTKNIYERIYTAKTVYNRIYERISKVKNEVYNRISQRKIAVYNRIHYVKNNVNLIYECICIRIESCKLGYKVCNWGLHVGHAGDIQYHINSIVQMERDEYNPAVRIAICKYDFCDTSIVWVDNLHSAIKYIREYGKDVKLRDIPFYVVDISDYEHPSIHGYNGSLREKHEDILGAVSCAYKRFRRSYSKELIEIGYTLKDFLRDNPMLYTELNTHLGLINTSDDADTIFDKSAAFNSLYEVEEYSYGQR